MKTTFISILLSFCLIAPLTAQDYIFRVMANNGSNLFRNVSSTSWTPVKRGVAFNSGDIVKVVDKAYVGLIHNSGKTFELIESGEFEIDDLAINIDTRKKGIGGKYTEFVMNTMDENIEEKKELVTRGGGSSVHVFLPAASEVLNDKQILTWDVSYHEPGEIFLVVVKGIFDDPLLTEEVTGNQYILDLSHPDLADETMFVITVEVKDVNGSVSKEHAFDKLTGTKRENLQSELDELMVELKEDSSLDQLIFSHFYERNGLLVDAASSYEKAINISPEVTDYKELYAAFRQRHNIH
jgi:hypothetical protein